VGYIAAIPAGLLQDPRIKPCHIRVYNALGSFCDLRTGRATPSHNTIAKLCGLTRSTVCRALRHLELSGWLDSIGRARKSGARSSNEYTIPFKRTYAEALAISEQRQNATRAVVTPTHEPVPSDATGNNEGIENKVSSARNAHTVEAQMNSGPVGAGNSLSDVGPRLPANADGLLEVKKRLRTNVGDRAYRDYLARCIFRDTFVVADDRYHCLRLIENFASELKAVGVTACVTRDGGFECGL